MAPARLRRICGAGIAICGRRYERVSAVAEHRSKVRIYATSERPTSRALSGTSGCLEWRSAPGMWVGLSLQGARTPGRRYRAVVVEWFLPAWGRVWDRLAGRASLGRLEVRHGGLLLVVVVAVVGDVDTSVIGQALGFDTYLVRTSERLSYRVKEWTNSSWVVTSSKAVTQSFSESMASRPVLTARSWNSLRSSGAFNCS